MVERQSGGKRPSGGTAWWWDSGVVGWRGGRMAEW